MKKLVLIFLFILHPTNYSTAYAIDNYPKNIYIVKPSDSLPEIASIYDTSVEDLIKTNGLQSNALVVGQKLLVPTLYEVNYGDTLEEISSAYNSPIETIKSTNGLTSEQLFAGQILKISPKKMEVQGNHIIMTKEEFKDWLFHNKFNRKITLIQHHHTWEPSYKRFNGSNYFELLSGMENYHKNKMGWKHIAQNITTFPDGKIAVSRPFNTAPEGSIGKKANSEGIAIENVGNFDIGHDVMSEEQKETIVYITALLCIKFGLTPSIDSITYHHWWNFKTGERVLDDSADYEVKTCPGTGFFGGNSTDSATKSFYPLISHKMEEVMATIE